ncbi:hypothetical protein IWQ60_001412 [Tieghemiomyces parasiticus]|uniref:Uncharacterized protein n=1 Tax=Tieghemiomyces parasiticus TaxID=78921 RepID=A0A9W8E1Y1_9FUNG|nr:hypothetical protein IWQ60_001412 [Tieghemiomyces parasiticus]
METTSPFARLMADLEPLKTNMPEFYNQITMLHQTYQDLMPRVWALNPRDPEREVLLTHCEDIRVNMERMALSLSSTVHPTQDHEHQNSQGPGRTAHSGAGEVVS